MKKILTIILLINAVVQAQSPDAFYKARQQEKVYAHLNNVLYLPEETVYFTLYATNANNTPTTQSDYVYADVYDGAGKPIARQCYLLSQGRAQGSFTLGKELPGGLYRIKAYTKMQQLLGEPGFEKSFFVQKVSAARLLMTLDFKKKGYGPGEVAEADFTLKSNDNQPLACQPFEYDAYVEGKALGTLTGVTNDEGKAVVRITLPRDIKVNDGIVNVKVSYEGMQESVTRSIPISLNYADLQFLPEGGQYIVGQPANVFFIAKNEFGKPLDVSGYIQDAQGNKVADFMSFYDGMGKVAFTPQAGKSYEAVLTAPFAGRQKYALPAPLKSGYSLMVENKDKAVEISFTAPGKSSCGLLIRNQDKVHGSFTVDLNRTPKYILPTTKYPIGAYAVSMVVDGQIVAERLVFLNYQDGLNITLQTDKPEYKPREKVQATIITKDIDGNPVPSALSISVVDEKLLSYIDDKQHNLLTWMYFGQELKGTVHEPRFYFDAKEPLEKRMQALDLLLNTHGWRRYTQQDVNGFTGSAPVVSPERSGDVEGFVQTLTGKPASLKVYLLTEDGKVYETKANNKGYFKFPRMNFGNIAWLVAESRRNRQHKIINSISNYNNVVALKDSLKVTGIEYNTPAMPAKQGIVTTTEAKQEVQGEKISLGEDSNRLEEVVVVGYGTVSRNLSNATVTTVRVEGVPLQNLAGRVAGVDVQTGTGQPGANAAISIRGARSVYSGDPLFVVDGIPMVNNENRSVLNTVSPHMIQSITVLKDANATAVYGSRGANGVILITTKNGTDAHGIYLGKTNHYTYEQVHQNGGRKLNTAAAFYTPVYTTTLTDEKTDFRNCLYWNGTVQTNAQGTAHFEFYNSDDTGTFSILAEGTSYKGDLGMGKLSYTVKAPLQTDVKLPLYSTQKDVINLPLWVKNNTGETITVTAELQPTPYFTVNTPTHDVKLAANEAKTVYFAVKAIKTGSKVPVHITVKANGFTTSIKKQMDINAKGFPVSVSFSGMRSATGSFNLANVVPNTIESELRCIVNPFTELTKNLEAMLREPYGCFEQVSSSNYPNIMALQLLAAKGGMDDAFKQKALGFLQNGYNKLKNYESKGGGFEWYGGNPGHEALTAYGLLQFHEMKDFVNVDAEMVKRATKWLYSRKNGNGGFRQHSGRYGFSGIPAAVNNAYIVYVLSEIGAKDFRKEYDATLNEALKSRDVYRMALMANAAFNLGDIPSYKKLLQYIKEGTEGKKPDEIKIEETVVHSYGTSKTVEWQALYALALMKEQTTSRELMGAIDHIQSAKNAYGFGSTQATALALKVITTYSKMAQYGPGKADLTASVNGVTLTNTYDNGGNIAINTAPALKEGSNEFAIHFTNTAAPYLLYINYQSIKPENSPHCQMELKTSLTQTKIKVSETTRIQAQVTNRTNEVVFNPIVRIGLPGGTSPEPWQLKELVEKEVVDYYEIFGSELVLYFRAIDAKETRKINIDLKAQIPGQYTGVASSAYLYYNNEHKNWNNGLTVEIVD
ncbi:hypothetical protein AM493_07035 [Flavobacterium akiainvivens]|uniref:Alpha-2-macroglobulin domain-containing protein n=1 Tax=Flavobacterium akiainvivens TaxID=1202724 RepID=A0A0M8MHP9_9FLAO|nr:TonB-dependent receptor plug domain-containing protein [Flavobacterium akiainvivens]KOS05818.1 hypothetical protein AM493_07035 [Flavobacterium akiainvivens]SFQ57178.1 TonB-dependent outer membrane receptor, SusC/RagA subfamily, signature region [Flavobacterium akiainvivens]